MLKEAPSASQNGNKGLKEALSASQNEEKVLKEAPSASQNGENSGIYASLCTLPGTLLGVYLPVYTPPCQPPVYYPLLLRLVIHPLTMRDDRFYTLINPGLPLPGRKWASSPGE